MKDCPVHTVTIPIVEDTNSSTTSSGQQRLLSTSSNQSVLIARTHTESVIDRSSPYNIIETSTDMDDDDDENDDENKTNDNNDDNETNNNYNTDDHDEVLMKEKDNTLSPSSSLTSGTDVYMDAVDILNDNEIDHRSGKNNLLF